MISNIIRRIPSFAQVLAKQSYRPFAFRPPNLKVCNQFYNREQEMAYLHSTLTTGSNDSIYVLFGQPNCGKTRLIKEFLKANPTAPRIYVDLRGIQLRTTSDLLEEIEYSLMGFAGQIKNRIKASGAAVLNTIGEMMWMGPMGDEALKIIEDKAKTIKKLERLLGKFGEACQKDTKIPFWFVLDDINSIKRIIEPNEKESIRDFQSLISLLVKASKQDGTCKALFGSTDSRLVIWMQEQGFEQGWFKPASIGIFYLCQLS